MLRLIKLQIDQMRKIKSNAIRTTANNICYPILFLCSQDKANYKFKDNRVMVNVMALSDEVVKSVFGFKKDKIGS